MRSVLYMHVEQFVQVVSFNTLGAQQVCMPRHIADFELESKCVQVLSLTCASFAIRPTTLLVAAFQYETYLVASKTLLPQKQH